MEVQPATSWPPGLARRHLKFAALPQPVCLFFYGGKYGDAAPFRILPGSVLLSLVPTSPSLPSSILHFPSATFPSVVVSSVSTGASNSPLLSPRFVFVAPTRPILAAFPASGLLSGARRCFLLALCRPQYAPCVASCMAALAGGTRVKKTRNRIASCVPWVALSVLDR